MGLIIWFALNVTLTACGYFLWDWPWWLALGLFLLIDVPLFLKAVRSH